MPRIRIEFSKGEQVRFLSHLDLMKTFERAIRRADIPIAFSEGFNPHPKMNFASALAVGVTSDAEYIDMELQQTIEPDEIVSRMALAMPPGIKIRRAVKVADNAPAMMAQVNRARYRVTAECENGVDDNILKSKIAAFMDSPEVNIVKRTKKGPRQKNIRPGIINFEGETDGRFIGFDIDTVISNEGNVRPEEVVSAFREHSGLSLDCDTIQIRRTGLYVEKDGGLFIPSEV